MRSGGGKGKGSDFERLIGTQLSKWMSNGEHSDWYWRSASSGSHFTTNAKASTYMAGDIAPVDPRGAPLLDVFTIECKHYKDLEPGKWVKVTGWEGIDAAKQEVLSGMNAYQTAHKKG